MPAIFKDADAHYRVIFPSVDGQAAYTLLIFAADDAGAKRKAKALVDGHGVDLWDGLRFIEHFAPIFLPK